MGAEKPRLPLGERTLIECVIEASRPVVRRLRIVGSTEALPRAGVLETQPDLRPGLGPLSGIHAALATAVEPSVLILGCDLPFLTASFLRGLVARLTKGFDAVVPRDFEGRPVPICAVYRTTCLALVERHLDEGRFSARALVERLRVRWVRDRELRELDPAGRALTNLNTPEDYRRARALVERGAPRPGPC